MKRALYGFTDYPITRLGDTAGAHAPIRGAKAISYDGDKYLVVEVGGVTETIKCGYFYKERGRCGEVPPFSYRDLEQLPVTRY